MKWVCIALLVGVFVVHDTAHWISAWTEYSAGQVFYMLMGMWTALLSVILAAFLLMQPRTLWRDLGIAALVISAIEGIEMPTCLLAIDVASVSKIPRGTNLCDYATGLPVGYVIESIYLFIVLRILWRGYARTP